MKIINRKIIEKCTAANERFHASGGVCPQTVLWEFGSTLPAGTAVNPRLREAATTLGASGGQRAELFGWTFSRLDNLQK
jgi:hypothetical protein